MILPFLCLVSGINIQSCYHNFKNAWREAFFEEEKSQARTPTGYTTSGKRILQTTCRATNHAGLVLLYHIIEGGQAPAEIF